MSFEARTAVRAAGALAALLAGGLAVARVPDEQNFQQIERGRYLVIAADCAACHSEPGKDQPFAGGRSIPTPFGSMIAPNITPDRDTGIGSWSDAQFDAVLRRGTLPDGKRVYPAMPYPYYTRMSRDDVLAIRAYLQTVPPVHHEVQSDVLPFPFNIRWLMRIWDALYFDPGPFQPDASRSAQWNRGAYLVEGPGHCGACHTPKTAAGGDVLKHSFQGLRLQEWFAPDITNDARSGLGAWSTHDVVDYLKRGHNRFAAASGPMAEEVAYSSSRMNDADLASIADFLKSQPGQSGTAAALSADNPAMVAGGAIYSDLCAACHQSDGSGVPYLLPNIAASASIDSSDPTTLIRVILEGTQTVATDAEPTAPAMPAFGWQLTDAQVAAVATYIRNSWSHAAPAVTVGEVRSVRRALGAAAR